QAIAQAQQADAFLLSEPNILRWQILADLNLERYADAVTGVRDESEAGPVSDVGSQVIAGEVSVDSVPPGTSFVKQIRYTSLVAPHGARSRRTT
ncbi:MAG TPA: hypothetical protein VFT28_12435, partial [Gemmatimonadales bacterium]|nr:hypothetical protein [Gemmatimonadales bacterium]